MKMKDEIDSVTPEKILPLHTARRPSFLGLSSSQGNGTLERFEVGNGVIIGVSDTGIQPHHPSFNDQGMPLPPIKWKGKCEFGVMTCNNKLIGARNFVIHRANLGVTVALIDEEGHGTHTSSIAAGNYVQSANVAGHANGPPWA